MASKALEKKQAKEEAKKAAELAANIIRRWLATSPEVPDDSRNSATT